MHTSDAALSHAETTYHQRVGQQVAAARRVAGGVMLLLLLLLCLLAGLRPRHFYLNGQALPLRQAGTAADCARLLGHPLQAGDLLDARGEILVAGGGLPVSFRRNGQPITPQTVIRGGDELTVCPGRDVTEPLTTTLRHLPPTPRLANGRRAPLPAAAASFVGLRREERGFSGQLGAVEIAQVSPVVNQPTGEKKLIALTFDDGPSPRYTPMLLKTLDKYEVRATFFVLGQMAQAYPGVLRQVVAGGHEIAIHSWSHPHLTRLTQAQVTADSQRCMKALRSLAGESLPLAWERPPYGSTNASVKAGIQAAGLQQILWSVDTNDWRKPGADVICQRILRHLHPGAVVLMHDGGGDRSQTVAALSRLLPELLARGYQPVTLSELKGLTSIFDGQVIYTIAGQEFRVHPSAPPLRVESDGQEVACPGPVLACNGQPLLPAVPTFERLGTACVYEAPTQSLLLASATGQFRLRLNSLRAERNGREVSLLLPPVLYGDRAYVPLQAILNITGATAALSPESQTLRLFSPGASPPRPQGEALVPPLLTLQPDGTRV